MLISKTKILKILFIALLYITITQSLFAGVEESKEYFENGKTAFNNKKYNLSLSDLLLAIEENKYNIEAYYLASKSYYHLEDYDNALRFMKKTESFGTDNVEVKIWIAKIQIMRKEFDSAEAYLNSAIGISPRTKSIYLAYGDLFYNKKNYKKAIDSYAITLEIDSKNTKALLKISDSFLKLGNKDEAIKYLDIAQTEDPTECETYYYLGKYYFFTENYLESEKNLKKALMCDSNDYDSINLLYHVLFKQNKWNESLTYLNQLYFKYPEKVNVYYNYGLALGKAKLTEQSIKVLKKGLQLEPDSEIMRLVAEKFAHDNLDLNHPLRKELADYYNTKSDVYLKQNLFFKGLVAFKRGIRLDPNNWHLRYKAAQLYKERRFMEKYLNELEIIYDLKPVESELDKETTDTFQKIKEEIDYLKLVIKKYPSSKLNINQYKIDDNILPRYAILSFVMEEIKDIEKSSKYHHLGEIVKDLLYSCIKAYNVDNSLNIDESDTISQYNEEIELARLKKADFIVKGNVEFDKNDILIFIDIFNLSYGEKFDTLKVVKRGEDSILNSCLFLADKLQHYFPPVGKIIEKSGKDVVINLGRFHDLTDTNNEFFIVKDKKIVDKLFSSKANKIFFSDKEKLKSIIMKYSLNQDFVEPEVLSINEIDEHISTGKIVTNNFFNSVSKGDYVIPILSKKEEQPQ